MRTKLKVLSGTRSSHAPRLCDTCQSGVVRKGASESDEHVFCLLTSREVRMRVIECSRYEDMKESPLWAMKEIAWVLHVDSKRQKVGFLRAKESERKHEDEELIPSILE